MAKTEYGRLYWEDESRPCTANDNCGPGFTRIVVSATEMTGDEAWDLANGIVPGYEDEGRTQLQLFLWMAQSSLYRSVYRGGRITIFFIGLYNTGTFATTGTIDVKLPSLGPG